MDSSIKNQLNEILAGLNKIDGVESGLISDNDGNILSHSMSRDSDLFGPMAHVIISSSKRLLDSANQGLIERVLVESENGKALFFHLENVNLIILMEVSANVGLVLVSAKRAALKIIEITKDVIFEEPVTLETEEITFKEPRAEILEKEETTKKSKIDNMIESSNLEPKEIEKVVKEITETKEIEEAFDQVVGSEELDEIMESPQFELLDPDDAKEKLTEILDTKIENNLDDEAEVEVEPEENAVLEEIKPHIELEKEVEELEISEEVADEELESRIPVIKPPISFPTLPDIVQIPENSDERVNLILDIYESIFLAMSIGASKIMGVSPARGLIKRFLPIEDYKTLLKDVEVKSNSAIDFDKIRENTESIPSNERDKTLITDFSKIIDIITENYGKVMGYGAFRGIVRAEFKIINISYGKIMEELGIKDKINPELKELFN
jgi:predicted regulator of Ras-like GTPase activity (Roadblock/LC7/MglB family)